MIRITRQISSLLNLYLEKISPSSETPHSTFKCLVTCMSDSVNQSKSVLSKVLMSPDKNVS